MREVQSDLFLALVQSAARVESEIETHTEVVAARLNGEFASVFEGWEEGHQKPNYGAQLRALKDKLGNSRENLSLTEERHIDLARQAVERRGERQELTADLYQDFSSLRRTVEELYRGKGKGNVNAFVIAGIQGPTAQKPTKLLRQVDLAVKHLLQPGLQFPVSRLGGTPLDPRELAGVLGPRADSLRQVQADLRRLASQMNASRKEKSRALKAHKTTFLWVARSAESLFHLAGEQELAERIRPSTRRPGRRAAEVADDEEDGSQAEGSQDGDASVDGSTAAAAGDGGSGEPAGEPESTASSAVAAESESASSAAADN